MGQQFVNLMENRLHYLSAICPYKMINQLAPQLRNYLWTSYFASRFVLSIYLEIPYKQNWIKQTHSLDIIIVIP